MIKVVGMPLFENEKRFCGLLVFGFLVSRILGFLVFGSLVSKILGFKDSWFLGFKDSLFLGFKPSKISVSTIQKSLNAFCR